MTDIQAIKKAAEALQKSDLLIDRFDYITALRDPATVLELCRLAEIGKQMELRRPPSLEELAARHKLHDCNRGRCACRCGCETIIGCRVSDDDLCGVCAVRDMRGDDTHGYPLPEPPK